MRVRVLVAGALGATLGLGGAADVCAQTAVAAPRVTLGEAVTRAAAQPPMVLAALARARAAAAQVDVAAAARLPTLTATGDSSLAFSDREIQPGARFQGLAWSSSVGLQGRMVLWDFGRTGNAVEAAEHGEAAARADARGASRTAMSAAAVAYFTVLSDRELVASVQATVAQREAHLRIATGLVEVGSRPPIERTRAQVDLDAARMDLTSAEANERNDRAALAAALGMDPAVGVEVLPVAPDALAADDDPARAATTAVATRPEFAAARARLAQAEAQAAATRAARNPTLSASVNGSVNYAEVLTGRTPGGISEQVNGGLVLSWPLVDYGVRANIAAAEANAAAARATLDAQALTVRTEAVQAAIAVQTARATLGQAERLAAGAAANLELAEGRYQGGAAPLLELIDAQAADATARVAVVRARLGLQLARVRLLAAVGGLEALRGVR